MAQIDLSLSMIQEDNELNMPSTFSSISIKFFLKFFLILGLLIKIQVSGCETQLKEKPKFDALLYLLDESDHRFLFRGKHPEKDGKLCYEELRSQIREYVSKRGKSLSNDFKVICVSLLNWFEFKERNAELGWFYKQPDKGMLFRFPIFGCFIDPLSLSPWLRKTLIRKNPDNLHSLMHLLRYLLHGPYYSGSDVVIYLHCYAGKDRTGEAAACYLMQYKGYSYREAISINTSIAKRNLRRLSLNAIRWYALYLRDIRKISTIGPIGNTDCKKAERNYSKTHGSFDLRPQ